MLRFHLSSAVLSGLALCLLAAPVPARGEAEAGRFDIQANLAKLKARQPKGEWTFAVMGDSRGGLGVLGALLQRVDQDQPAFTLYTGDLVGESTQRQWADVRATLDRAAGEVPILPVVGNHETYGEGIKLFLAVFGNPSPNAGGPIDYAFDHGGARFVMMDNSREGKFGPEGFTDEQIAWLDRKLENAPPLVFVAAHKPPNTARWTHAFYHNSKAFTATLARHRVAAALFGHIHFYDRYEQGGVDYFVCGGAGAPLYHWEGGPDAGNPKVFESPKGVKAHNFMTVTVKGDRATFRTFTDEAKLARLKPARSAGIELGPDDFLPWEAGELGAARRVPAGAGVR